MFGGPRLYRFYNYESVDYLPAPVDGWNPDVNPWELPENQAYVLDNFLLKPGKIVMRGGISVVTDFSAQTPPLAVCGVAAPGQFLIARKNMAAAGLVDPWNAVMLGSASGVLASGSTAMLYANTAGVITGVAAANADQIIGPRWINFDGTWYGISYDTAGAAVHDQSQSYFMKPLSLLTLSTSLRATNQVAPKPTSAVDTSFVGSNSAWAANSGGISQPSGYNWSSYGPGGVTDYLVCTNYGLKVPSGATITGIEVAVTKGCNFGLVVDDRVRLVKAGVVGTTDKADVLTQWVHPDPASSVAHYGGSSDMWGTTWTPTDVNNGGFGVAFSAGIAAGAPGNDGPVVYGITITVYYTVTVNTATPLPTVLTNAPHGAFDLKGYQSRIWLLGGIDTPGAGTVHKATAIFFTNPIVGGGGTASADWKDPVSGLTNQIVMDNNTPDFGVALAQARNGLVILRRSSVWLLRGSSTSTYSVLPVSKLTGCIDARSAVETDRGVYFMSQQGLMLTDGATVVNVSGSCMTTIQDAVALQQQRVLAGNGGHVSCGLTSQGQILVSIGSYNAAGNIVPIWSALYDPAVKGGAWVRLTSQLFAGDGIQASPNNNYPGLVLSQRAPHLLYVLGDKYLTQLEDQTANKSFLIQQGLYDRSALTLASSVIANVGAFASTGAGTGPWVSSATDLRVTDSGAGSTSETLQITAFGFAIPVGATINGIQLDIPRSSLTGITITDLNVQLVKGGVAVGSNLADTTTPWPPVYGDKTYGGQGNLWGTTLAPADINAAGFGFEISVTLGAPAPGKSPAEASISKAAGTGAIPTAPQITVYYTGAAGLQYFSIPAVWRTKFAPIIGTTSLARRFGHAKRFFFDYLFAGNGILAPSGWSVTPVDATDAPYASGMRALIGSISSSPTSISGGNAFPSPAVQRQNQDFTRELTELGFDVTWTDQARLSDVTNVVAEIYGIGIESQRTQDAR